MIILNVPGRGAFQFEHLVSDVNGTLAVDGALLPGVAERLKAVQEHLTLHLLTADTHGKQAIIDQQLGVTAVRVKGGGEAGQKAEFVRNLGAEKVIALGQGANDALMLREAALGICVLSPEGTAVEALLAADIVVPDVTTALDLLLNPTRLVASLRR
ncbi:MAG: ATPase P [Chloroflexi bacterium]|nr:ATPase P [Chloroflexota bacterium]